MSNRTYELKHFQASMVLTTVESVYTYEHPKYFHHYLKTRRILTFKHVLRKIYIVV